MLAEIIAIGDELTSGQRLDTNSQWLSQQLSDLGITTICHQTIGDYLQPMVQAFRLAATRADVIIVTGGLGPTADDLTRQAIAYAFATPLKLDQASWEHIQSLFKKRNFPIPPNNKIQAMFPVGAGIIPNATGSAPGIDWKIPGKTVKRFALIDQPDSTSAQNAKFQDSINGQTPLKSKIDSRFFCLPGVPAEMKDMLWATVAIELTNWMGAKKKIITRRILKTFGAGESHVESLLPDLIRRGNDPQVGITASKGTISLRIEAHGKDAQQCEHKIAPVVNTIRETLGDLVFGEAEQELEDVATQLLQSHRQQLTVIEWGTSGLVSNLLGQAAKRMTKSDSVAENDITIENTDGDYGFQGSVILNHAAAVQKWLAPDAIFEFEKLPSQLRRQNCQTVVRDLAQVASTRFQSSLTVAGGPLPNPESDGGLMQSQDEQPFLFQIAAIKQSQTGTQLYSKSFTVLGHTSIWQTRAAKQILNHIRLILMGKILPDADADHS